MFKPVRAVRLVMLVSATGHRRRRRPNHKQKKASRTLGLLPLSRKRESDDGRLYILYRKA